VVSLWLRSTAARGCRASVLDTNTVEPLCRAQTDARGSRAQSIPYSRLAKSPPSVSRLSRTCGSLDLSQPCTSSLHGLPPKHSRAVEIACHVLAVQFTETESLLGMLRVTSTFRTIKVVWISFGALYSHFINSLKYILRN
jgi:hypothetical protein